MNPDWPTKADPVILDAVLCASKYKTEKSAYAKALEITQERLLSERRKVAGGVCSENLDWINLIGKLRQEYSSSSDRECTIAWFDYSCPIKDQPINVETVVNYQEYSQPDGCSKKYRYCYVTIKVQK